MQIDTYSLVNQTASAPSAALDVLHHQRVDTYMYVNILISVLGGECMCMARKWFYQLLSMHSCTPMQFLQSLPSFA